MAKQELEGTAATLSVTIVTLLLAVAAVVLLALLWQRRSRLWQRHVVDRWRAYRKRKGGEGGGGGGAKTGRMIAAAAAAAAGETPAEASATAAEQRLHAEIAALQAECAKLRALGGVAAGPSRPRLSPLKPLGALQQKPPPTGGTQRRMSSGAPPAAGGAAGGTTPGDVFAKMRAAMDARFERVLDTFKRLDASHNGRLARGELRTGLAALGFTPSEEDCAAVFEALDKDGSGSVDYFELAHMLEGGGGSDVKVRVD